METTRWWGQHRGIPGRERWRKTFTIFLMPLVVCERTTCVKITIKEWIEFCGETCFKKYLLTTTAIMFSSYNTSTFQGSLSQSFFFFQVNYSPLHPIFQIKKKKKNWVNHRTKCTDLSLINRANTDLQTRNYKSTKALGSHSANSEQFIVCLYRYRPVFFSLTPLLFTLFLYLESVRLFFLLRSLSYSSLTCSPNKSDL